MIAIGGGSQKPRCLSSSRAIADISCLAQMLAPARRQSERWAALKNASLF